MGNWSFQYQLEFDKLQRRLQKAESGKVALLDQVSFGEVFTRSQDTTKRCHVVVASTLYGESKKTQAQAQSTQDAGHDARANWNDFPLMLLGCSVDTPIHINRSHLLASLWASRPASCVDWASRHKQEKTKALF